MGHGERGPDLDIVTLFAAIAEQVGERPCIVQRDTRCSYRAVAARAGRFGRHLLRHGLGVHTPRSALRPWESGHDHVAIHLDNRPEYLEVMLGAFAARALPFNVNYRYGDAELVSLFRDARPAVVVYASSSAGTMARVAAAVTSVRVLVQVDDGTSGGLLPGASWYHELAEDGDEPDLLGSVHSPDDLYMLYTGGTTGAPKGVLWRQADCIPAAFGVLRPDGTEHGTIEEAVARGVGGGPRVLVAPPLMHGSAQWSAFLTMLTGGTVVLLDAGRGFHPADAASVIEREQVDAVLLVGDAFARPLVDALAAAPGTGTSLRQLVSGGAALSASTKDALLAAVPGLRVIDLVGSSESGGQGRLVSAGGAGARTGVFWPSTDTCVLSADRTTVLDAPSAEPGWLARRGRIPLGYLGDAERTRRTFPVIDGVRYVVAGDRVELQADGSVRLLGRDAATINTGGEKVFAEEVEEIILRHPGVRDAVVMGRPSERWGEEVVALVEPAGAAAPDPAAITGLVRAHLAGYKVPREVVVVEAVGRLATGKVDYAWARAALAAHDSGGRASGEPMGGVHDLGQG